MIFSKQMNHQSGATDIRALTVLGFTAFAVVLSFFVGNMVADNDYTSLSLIAAAVIALMVLFSVGDNYWIFIPLTAGLEGSFTFLPLPLNLQELGSCSAFGIFVAYAVFKKTRTHAKLSWLDIILAINIAYLLTVWVRNPVGFNSMGGEMVGGRPYFTTLVAYLGYLVIRRVRAPVRLLYWLPALVILPHFLLDLLNLVTQFYPKLGLALLPFYSGVDISAISDTGGIQDDTRLIALGKLGRTIIQSMVSYFPPATFFHPSRYYLIVPFIAAFVMIGLSGFRSELVGAAASVGISSFLRKRKRDLVVYGAAGLVGIMLIAGVHQTGFSVPIPIQRALSFLPLNWDARATVDATGSSEWRFEMWEAALKPNSTIIRNKLLGDGFGFSALEWNIIRDKTFGLGEGFIGSSNQEAWIVKGSFHSGPISSIRFVGYVGLALFMWLQLYFLFHVVKLVPKALNTRFMPLAIYIGIWVVYTPFEFVFIFGAYDMDVANLLGYAGLARLLENSMESASPTT
jgi:hypothetical protein